MKIVKHQSEYDPAIKQAETNFHSAGGKEMKEMCPYIFSSNFADAYWITAWCLYSTGRLPKSLHKSIGQSWLCDLPSLGIIRAWVDEPNQRRGIRYTKELT